MSQPTTSPAAARRAARDAARPTALVLADGVAERIATYAPTSITPEVWAAVRPLVTAVVAAAAPTTPDRAQHLMLPAAKLAIWAIERGVPLERSTVFTETMVEEWARAALAAKVPASSVATHRSHLRALLPASPSPTATVGRSGGPNPYTNSEDLALRRAVTGQRTPVYRSTGCLLYGLSRGAGLDAAAIRGLRAEDVADHGDGIEVRLSSRSVWVLDTHADVVRVGLDSCSATGSGYLVGGRDGQRRNIAEYVGRFTAPAGTPHLNIARCRATWILDHLRRGTPLRVIRDTLGVRSLGQIEALLDLVEAPSPAAVAGLLRGAP